MAGNPQRPLPKARLRRIAKALGGVAWNEVGRTPEAVLAFARTVDPLADDRLLKAGIRAAVADTERMAKWLREDAERYEGLASLLRDTQSAHERRGRLRLVQP